MSFIEQLTAIALLVDFLIGVTFGIVGVASLASRHEDLDYSLTHAPPDPLCEGARVIHGVYPRGDGFASDALRDASPGDNGWRGGGDRAGAQGQEPQR